MYVDFATCIYRVTVIWFNGNVTTIDCKTKLSAVRHYNRIVRGSDWLHVEWSPVPA